MNKINVIVDEKDNLDGYDNLTISKIEPITNGTCEEIVCSVLDKYPYDERVRALVMLCKKLANLGSITLKYTNTTKVCKEAFRGNINSKFLSNIVLESSSLFLETDIIEIAAQIEGITIYKHYNDNFHTIVVIKKQL